MTLLETWAFQDPNLSWVPDEIDHETTEDR